MTNQWLQQTRKTSSTRMGAMVLLSGVIVCAAPTVFAADRLVPGQYELVNTAEGKTTTGSYCATPEMAKGTNGDAKSAQSYAESAAKSCSFQSFDLTGDTLSYTLLCSGHATSIHAVYHGDHFESDMSSTVNGKLRTIHTTAKRVGDCTPDKR